jgi:ribosome-binding ATPase YchF (GTP1/OBG family)
MNSDEGKNDKTSDLIKIVSEFANKREEKSISICAKFEAELSCLSENEKEEFLKSSGIETSGLDLIIKSGYDMLGLITFFTVGETETRAWKIVNGAKAPQAAGVIHSDFEKGFIRAETISFKDFVLYNGEQGCKDAGKMKTEGKDYIVQDGDVMHFRFNV